jgi:hypothetical protein
MDSLRVSDEAAAAVQISPNRVTLDHLHSLIVSEEFLSPVSQPQLTICVLVLKNGFSVLGKSAVADPANFNAELGRRFAKEDAVRQMWPLEAYALRERLAAEGK